MNAKERMLRQFNELKEFVSSGKGAEILDDLRDDYRVLYDDYQDRIENNVETQSLRDELGETIKIETLLDQQKLAIVKRLYTCLSITTLESLEKMAADTIPNYANESLRVH